MNVFFDKERGAFRLDTPRSSYIMALADGKWLGHVYNGPRLAGGELDWAEACLDLDEKPYTPDRCLSACLTLPYEKQKLVTLHGSWARERGVQVQEIARGFQGTSSRRGISSHQEHPFLAVVSPDAAQERGEVYAMHFVYSGNFLAQVQRDQFDQLRVVMGIHPEEFSWKLEPGEAFQAPEAVMVYSAERLGGMTRALRDLYRGHLICRPYGPRPVLLNNWEATYFDFDEERLLEIAARAAGLGVELFVLDDGWFVNRSTDSGGLGDWEADRKKLPHGLAGLARRLKELGLDFGLWMKPEMVSVDSRLYREHPDWALQTGRRRPMLCRDQLALDLGRPEVEEYGWRKISGTLRSAPISYLKMGYEPASDQPGKRWTAAGPAGGSIPPVRAGALPAPAAIDG